jgi:chemotaxis signal transduction protein
MSATTPIRREEGDRLLTFEVSDTVYALPISGVLEVAEIGRICCVPTVPTSCGGVVNWHGDALPIVWPSSLFGEAECQKREDPEDEAVAGSGQQVLVVSDRPDDQAQIGLPIDRVIGLVDGPIRMRPGAELVAERRPVDGRVVSVLDPRRLVARAIEVIKREAG